MKMIKNHKGFSFIELMIVVGITVGIIAITIPKYNAYRYKSKRSATYVKIDQIVKAENMAYLTLGIYPLWKQPNGATLEYAHEDNSSNANARFINGERVFDACAAQPCGNYEYQLGCTNTNVGADWVGFAIRNNEVPNILTYGDAWGVPRGSDNGTGTFTNENFVISAAGKLTPLDDNPRVDILSYDSATRKIAQLCDELDPANDEGMNCEVDTGDSGGGCDPICDDFPNLPICKDC